MKGLPFNAEMALAVWEGRKSVTRRPMKEQPDQSDWKQEFIDTPKEWRKQAYLGPQHMSHDPDMWCLFNVGDSYGAVPYTGRKSPYSPSEVVYMQEPWVPWPTNNKAIYRATDEKLIGTPKSGWRSPVTMPFKASRLHLKLTVRPERLWEITEEEAIKEGLIWEDVESDYISASECYRLGFKHLWDSIYGKTFPSSSNPYIWRYGLEEVWRR